MSFKTRFCLCITCLGIIISIPLGMHFDVELGTRGLCALITTFIVLSMLYHLFDRKGW